VGVGRGQNKNIIALQHFIKLDKCEFFSVAVPDIIFVVVSKDGNVLK
jgi:hypothetical protein